MIDGILAHIAPHLCCGCGKSGDILCENCKYDIIENVGMQCFGCGVMTSASNICHSCVLPYSRAWYVGERSGVLQRLIGDFKFQNTYAAYRSLADLLLARLDLLPVQAIIVPIPTVSSHIRQRGYDHTLLIARRIANIQGRTLQPVLARITSTKQRDATKSQRLAQAKRAFKVVRPIDPRAVYVLIDDVITTGATVYYAAQALRDAGAGEVWVAVIARQPLD